MNAARPARAMKLANLMSFVSFVQLLGRAAMAGSTLRRGCLALRGLRRDALARLAPRSLLLVLVVGRRGRLAAARLEALLEQRGEVDDLRLGAALGFRDLAHLALGLLVDHLEQVVAVGVVELGGIPLDRHVVDEA